MHIVESTPPWIFDAAVTDALTHWTFKAEGQTYVVEVPINFVLKQ